MSNLCLFTVNNSQRRLSWEINNICNLNCSYCCNESSGNSNGGHLTRWEYINIIRKIQDFGVNNIYLTGGEAFLNPYIYEIINLCSGFSFLTVATNGTLVDLRQLAHVKHKENMKFHVSIDSVDESLHDYIRGQSGTFQKALGFIKGLIKQNYKVRVGTIVWSGNSRNLLDVVKFCDDIGVEELVLSWILSCGRGKKLSGFYPDYSRYHFLDEIYPWLKTCSKHVRVITKRHLAPTEECYGCLGFNSIMHLNWQNKLSPCSWLDKFDKSFTTSESLLDCTVDELMLDECVKFFFEMVRVREAKFGIGCPVACKVNSSSYYSSDPLVEKNILSKIKI